ncbi:hypothetical protein R3P38DRAFT_2924642 [Favolaschia claudopus]|uniref:Secreted protein n=1 Tax=Favolaschia claudopus TaxID=2862362 RepID=A0AAW0BZI5_9AGAR
MDFIGSGVTLKCLFIFKLWAGALACHGQQKSLQYPSVETRKYAFPCTSTHQVLRPLRLLSVAITIDIQVCNYNILKRSFCRL